MIGGGLALDLLKEILRGIPSAAAGLWAQQWRQPAAQEVRHECRRFEDKDLEDLREACLSGRIEVRFVLEVVFAVGGTGLLIGYCIGRCASGAVRRHDGGRRGVLA